MYSSGFASSSKFKLHKNIKTFLLKRRKRAALIIFKIFHLQISRARLYGLCNISSRRTSLILYTGVRSHKIVPAAAVVWNPEEKV